MSRDRRVAPSTICVAFIRRAVSTSALPTSSPTTSRYVPPRRSTSVRWPREGLVRRRREAVLRSHVHRDEVALRPLRHARGAPDEPVAVGGAGERDEHPLARLPRALDPVDAPVLVEGLVDAVGDPQQRELPQRAEVPCPEVVAERGVDPLRRIDVPVGHAPAERLRAHVDELDLVGAPGDLVRDRLALGDPRDPLHDVVERLEVLDVQRRDDGDAGVEQLVDVLPALLVARARGRSCARARRRARPRACARGGRRRPSPRTSRRGTRSCGAGRPRGRRSARGSARGRGSRRRRRRRPCRDPSRRRPSPSIANVLPTPGAAPR